MKSILFTDGGKASGLGTWTLPTTQNCVSSRALLVFYMVTPCHTIESVFAMTYKTSNARLFVYSIK